MKIRSITCFCNPLDSDFQEQLKKSYDLVQKLRNSLGKAGWEVQTARLATIPFSQYARDDSLIEFACTLEEKCLFNGYDYLSVGPASLSEPRTYDLIPILLTATRNVFTSAHIAHPHNGISPRILESTAKVIHKAARISSDGFANLRFCAMSHVRPFTPFFPAAYSYGPGFSFGLAIEAADAAVAAFNQEGSIEDAQHRLSLMLNDAGEQLESISLKIASRFRMPFRGIDFSPAPFPQDSVSIGQALELLGVKEIGQAGSLGCAAILAGILDQGNWSRTGYNGLMLPVLEDSILADRTASGNLSIKDLIMYSAVCGTGLDTIPLPGDISGPQIEALLFDIAAQSLRLRKPLTARLMPIPGLKAKDATQFDFGFFKNSAVMEIPASPLTGRYRKSDWIKIFSR